MAASSAFFFKFLLKKNKHASNTRAVAPVSAARAHVLLSLALDTRSYSHLQIHPNMPKKTSNFSVNPQIAQENLNPNGYTTQLTFYVSGSNIATSTYKRRRTMAPSLTPLSDIHQTMEGPSHGAGSMNYGLMTPQTPSNHIVHPAFEYGQHNPYSSPFPSQHQYKFNDDHYYHQNSNPPPGASLLFTAPSTLYHAPVHPPDLPTPQSAYPDDYEPFPYANGIDLDAFAPDLSPLNSLMAMPPEFLDQRDFEISTGDDSFEDTELESTDRKKCLSKSEAIIATQESLTEARLTPTLMLINLLESAQEGGIHARLGEAFFRQTNEENICRLLDLIMDNKKGAATLKEWMRPHAIALVCDMVHNEMEAAKPFLRMTTAETTTNFIESWDINAIMDPVSNDITPMWMAVLTAATEPKHSRVEVEDGEEESSPSTCHTAEKISEGPHAFSYDNVNFISSKYVEQRPGAMCKVQSGTFPVIYELQGTAVNISIILFKYSPEFDNISGEPLLQHKPRRPLPIGRKTRFYPLSVSTIEEASVTGNLHVHNNAYIEQLHHDPKTLGDNAIPSLNDQLTNARIRGMQSLRAKDLAFGTFHLVMNLIWALLHTHKGTAAEHGSLTHYFNLLEKARLGNDRPDYHTLLAALTQILDGLILNAWRSECGFDSLDAFAASNPTPANILRIAGLIHDKYGLPIISTAPTEVPAKRKADALNDEPSTYIDSVHSNTILLTRDLFAISAGDFGRIEDILPQIACTFRGAGSNNYSMEVLHLLFNIKQVWPPEFADVMRDIMLVNPSGLPGRHMPIDMNIEHLIGYLKALFAAKGLYSNWERLGSISASINYLQLIKKRVTTSLGCGYQGSTHKTPDTSMLVFRITDRACELKLQEYVENREIQSKPVLDLHRIGYQKFGTASLAIFNKKINEYKSGQEFDNDEIFKRFRDKRRERTK
ncbi:hypothetical protein BJ912DRAFT_934026 [Pholiota molesta]|nr:hypothetical protein BJ912DRAFT_934026 [Pholiota molesta]